MENYQKTKQQLKEQFGTLNGLTSKEAEEKTGSVSGQSVSDSGLCRDMSVGIFW